MRLRYVADRRTRRAPNLDHPAVVNGPGDAAITRRHPDEGAWRVAATRALLGLALTGCLSAPTLRTSRSASLTAATVSAVPLDDGRIASIARRIIDGQRTLAELAAHQGEDRALRLLARRFADELARRAPSSRSVSDPTTIEDDLVERDVALTLHLARYAGDSFDRRFVDADAAVLDADVDLLSRALAPRANDPALKAELDRLGARLAEELRALRSLPLAEGGR